MEKIKIIEITLAFIFSDYRSSTIERQNLAEYLLHFVNITHQSRVLDCRSVSRNFEILLPRTLSSDSIFVSFHIICG